ncbi:hypothetical protein BBB39_13075 [Bordetella trematum]|nr:hypothetical protein BBB39_13075 [Bordetella trematum]
MDLMGAYPGRSFRVVELVRHVTKGRELSSREREAARKAVRRVLAAMVENGTAHLASSAEMQGGYDEYSMSHKWDMTSEKVGQKVGQYPQRACVY